jgi:acetyltransferase-like isoleucine patch superfamily enzyme
MNLLKDLVYFFINHILNRIPSKSIRMAFYSMLSKGNISKNASIGLGVKILDIRNVKIGDFTNINFDSILDGRGEGIDIGDNVDIAPQVNIWSLEHQTDSHSHESKSGKVVIGSRCWLANRVTVLPGTIISENCIVAANSLVKGNFEHNSILMGTKATIKKIRSVNMTEQLTPLRRFR